ncbi:MAG TPA: NAD-dependent epimerase/dehydratase family protein [Puia sp.]|nr:NAD-dependent epimerase/dehydratase family protein [Puia sp.]
MTNKQTIIILGSEGFIGSHLVKYFTSLGYSVAGCDLLEDFQRGYQYFKVSRLAPEWNEIFSDAKYDYCINAAGSGNVPYSMSHPLIDFEANTLDALRILEAIRQFNPQCKYIHISSAAVYGNPASLPIKEEAIAHPLSPYGWHKLMSEQICREYYEIYSIALAIVRPFSVYGNGLRKQLLWDLCKKIRQDEKVGLFGTGNESRDFIHIADLCFVMECIMKNSSFKADIYNAANGSEVTVRHMANLLLEAYGSKKSIIFNGEQRVGDPVNWRADISRIQSLGYKAVTTLEAGVSEYVSYFKSLPPRS